MGLMTSMAVPQIRRLAKVTSTQVQEVTSIARLGNTQLQMMIASLKPVKSKPAPVLLEPRLSPPPASSTTTPPIISFGNAAPAASSNNDPSMVVPLSTREFPLPYPLIPSDYTMAYPVNEEIPISGLHNFGVTCYMNAVLQCIRATVPFARFLAGTSTSFLGVISLTCY